MKQGQNRGPDRTKETNQTGPTARSNFEAVCVAKKNGKADAEALEHPPPPGSVKGPLSDAREGLKFRRNEFQQRWVVLNGR